MNKHVMIDIETLGDESNSVITAIGAVVFTMENGVILEEGSTFHENIDIQSCLNKGLKVTGSTVAFWLHQDKEVISKMLETPKELTYVLLKFSKWLERWGGRDLYTWSRSPRFDHGLLQDAYTTINSKIPWDFRKERDVRTYVEQVPGLWEITRPVGILHSPVNDCLRQIIAVIKAYSLIKIEAA